jgi:prefoldin subunit 5
MPGGKGLTPVEKHRAMAIRGMAGKYNTKGAEIQRKLDDATKKNEELERELRQYRANAAGSTDDIMRVDSVINHYNLGTDSESMNETLRNENERLKREVQDLTGKLQDLTGKLQDQQQQLEYFQGDGGLGLFGEGVASGIENSWIDGNLPVEAVESDSADQPLLFFQQSPKKSVECRAINRPNPMPER